MTAPTSSSAPAPRQVADVHGPNYLTEAQLAVFLRPIRSTRVSRDGKGFSHVEAYEIRAHLNRLLGFARWSEEVVSQDVVFEDSWDKPKGNDTQKVWTVCYRSLVRLTVCAPDGTQLAVYTEGATGDATNMPSRADAHDMALKTSQSQAFKRCAINLGDQFGLSLYNKGSMSALVQRTVLYAVPDVDGGTAEVDAHLTTPLAPENNAGEPDTSARETSSPPPARPRTVAAADTKPATPAAAASGEAPAPTQSPAGDVNAGSPSPAMAGQDDPAPAPAGVSAAPASAPAEPSRSSVASGEPMDEVMALFNAMALQSPNEAIRTIGVAMTIAVKNQLRGREMPGQPGMTVGAALTARMRQAQAAIQAAKSA